MSVITTIKPALLTIKKGLWYIAISVFIIFEDVPDGLSSLIDTNGQQQPEKTTNFITWLVNIFNSKNIIYIAVILFWLTLISTLTATIFYFSSKEAVFMATANVEQLSILSQDRTFPKWKIKNATLYTDCEKKVEGINGFLQINNKTYIELNRIQRKELIINLDNDNNHSTGTFTDSKGKIIKLKDCSTLVLQIKENDSIVLPIEGEIKLGGEIKEATYEVPLLYSGEITIIDKTLISGDFYSVGPFELNMGDIFTTDSKNQERDMGFIYVGKDNAGNEKGITASFSSKAKKGYIKKYRTENIEIKNGLWTKLYNDQSLIILWFVALFLFGIFKAVIRIQLSKLSRDYPQCQQ